jgi:hypothetical protein
MLEQPEVLKIVHQEYLRVQREIEEFKLKEDVMKNMTELLPNALKNLKTEVKNGVINVSAPPQIEEKGMS